MAEEKKTIHYFDFIGRIIEIMRILQAETDEYTTISQSKILELMGKHEYPCSERTLTDYLKVLMKELNPEEFDGYVDKQFTISDYKIIPYGLEEKLRARDIGLEKEGSKKLQLRKLRYNHLFSFEELNQIVESILFLKNIDDDAKRNLIVKLQSLSSRNYPKFSPFISETTGHISTHIAGVFEDSRVDEVVVRENLTIIRQAIEADRGRGCKISFHFNGYNEEKKLVPKLDSNGEIATFIASPYYVILYNGKYYLICSVEPYSNVSIYRIDLMSNISDEIKTSIINHEAIAEVRKSKREVKGLPKDWNKETASEFQAEHMYMFYGEPVNILIKIDRNRYTLLHDFFGDRYQFRKHIDEQWDEVEVKCVPKAMESWAMQCADYVEILSPMKLRESIQSRCYELYKRYS